MSRHGHVVPLFAIGFAFCAAAAEFGSLIPATVTPGYGISDYFELMPGKVLPAAVRGGLRAAPEPRLVVYTRWVGGVPLIAVEGCVAGTRLSCAVFSMTGACTQKQEAQVSDGAPRATLAIRPHLSAGVYLVSVRNAGRTATIKVTALR